VSAISSHHLNSYIHLHLSSAYPSPTFQLHPTALRKGNHTSNPNQRQCRKPMRPVRPYSSPHNRLIKRRQFRISRPTRRFPQPFHLLLRRLSWRCRRCSGGDGGTARIRSRGVEWFGRRCMGGGRGEARCVDGGTRHLDGAKLPGAWDVEYERTNGLGERI
jgi:hypothetical protein